MNFINNKIIISILAGALIIFGTASVYLAWQNQSLETELTRLQNESIMNKFVATDIAIEEKSSVAASSLPDSITDVFELNKKEPGTKIYYSEKLGVGFTYASPYPGVAVDISESGDIINVNGQTIEVFIKDPGITFQQALEQRFLQGYSGKDCFIQVGAETEQGIIEYVRADISYPIPDESDETSSWWENAAKCPENYSRTNGIQYFLMNEKVPGKFIFVRIGQDSAASDGTPKRADGGGYNWSHSIRILE